MAWLFLGVAYVELDQEPAAKQAFARALELDPSLQLLPEHFSERAFFLFQRQRSGRLVDLGEYQPRDQQLAAAIQQLNAGDYETAVISLDACVRRLTEHGDRRDLAAAYLHLGIAYIGLEHETAGSSKFRQALHIDPYLNLDAGHYSARTVRLFQMEQLRQQLSANKATGKTWQLIGGAIAAGGVVVAASVNSNKGPTVNGITINPTYGLRGVTGIEFGAQARDLEHDALVYRWDFGDGASASGQLVRHMYAEAGRYTVGVTIQDAKGNKTLGTASVFVGTLDGVYRVQVGGRADVFSCVQAGPSLNCQGVEPSPTSPYRIEGTLSHPLLVELSLYEKPAGAVQVLSCFGQAAPQDQSGFELGGASDPRLSVHCGPIELNPQ